MTAQAEPATTPLGLRFMADWGAFNLTRICGWLAFEVWDRTGGRPSSVIHTGRGCGDNVRALARGEVDVAVATPAQFVQMAREGRGSFAGEAVPQIRAIGSLPHADALLFAVPAATGITTMAQLRETRPALRIALSPDDGESFMGLGAVAHLRASGIEPEEIVQWGGELVYGEDPGECVAHVNEGRADAIIQEAIMTPWWNELANATELSFLSLEPEAVAALERDYGLSTVEVPAGYMRGLDRPVTAIDFAGWLVCVRDDLDDDIAELLASIVLETSDVLERQYRHIPQRSSPLAYPITPEKLADTRVPLHPGAQRRYARALA
jgi:TRAP-type uncharacterized transport system substrate-binding protein